MKPSLILAALLTVILGLVACSDDAPTQAPVELPPTVTYTVQSGDYLLDIAQEHSVSAESVMALNQVMLQDFFDAECPKYHERMKRRGRKPADYYCNLENTKWHLGNTIQPGMTLLVPDAKAIVPPEIVQAAADIQGNDIGLVIDVSGSMSDDRAAVASLWDRVLRESGKSVTTYTYVDGNVNKVEGTTIEQLSFGGQKENTFEALLTAADNGHDSLVVISDEAGDDWDMSSGILGSLFGPEISDLPPVTANCIGSQCDATFRRVADESGGQFVPIGR